MSTKDTLQKPKIQKNTLLQHRLFKEIEEATKSFYFPTGRIKVFRYSIAVFYTIMAFLINQNSVAVLGTQMPFLIFFGAVTLSALQGGFGPGILATGFSAILIWAFYLSGRNFFPVLPETWQIIVFMCEGALISVISESRLRSEMERLKLLILEHEARKLLEKEIKEKEVVESELLNSRNELSVILREVDDGITVQDSHGKLVFANEAAARLTGFSSAEDFLATPAVKILEKFDMFDDFGKPVKVANLPGRKALAEKISSKQTISFKIRETGEEKWSIVRSSPVLDASGKVQFAVNVFHDITEQRVLDKRKDEFMGLVSHELRTPLTSLLGFIELLEKHWSNKKDAKTKRYLGYIHEEVTRLSGMVMDFLDVTRVRVGKLIINRTHFRVNDFLTETLEGLQFMSSTHRIVLKNNVKTYIFADRARLAQVLTNFLTNAIKYSPNAKKIVLMSSKTKNSVTISVQDFGIGINPDDQKEIFNLFYQSADPSRPSRGLGIGLYIASQIVEAHGGKIWLKSAKGKGSTFYFSLPVPGN